MTETETVISSERPNPQLIQELFDKDPLSLSDQDIDTIILEFRLDRAEYLQPKEAKPKKVSAAKAAKDVKESSQTTLALDPADLKDLGLDL